jgi:Leucine-rich repeat (LRR) protein
MRHFRLVTLVPLLLLAGCLAPNSSFEDKHSSAVAWRKQVITEIRDRHGIVDVLPGDKDSLVISVDIHGFHDAAKLLVALDPLSKLNKLNLYNTGFTDADLDLLHGDVHLTDLNLNGNPITDIGVGKLRELTNLQKLLLHNTKVTDQGVAVVRELPNLDELSLGGHVTDAGVAQLHDLKKLRDLSLQGSGITDECLPSLKTLTGLKHLVLDGTHISKDGIQDLHKAMPSLQIVH